MLMPKRVKRRKQHRGRMKGIATKGNAVAYGSYGLMADGRGWIDSKQIEAARVAMTRSDRGCPCSNDKIHQKRRQGLHQDLPA